MESNNSKNFAKGTVFTHCSLGDGSIIDIDDRYVEIKFSNGIIRKFPVQTLEDPSYFRIKGTSEFDGIKIERITAKNLFGSINNDFIIDNNYRVSILTAPNGYGKTTTFKLLMFLLAPTYKTFQEICTIPFDKFSCTLSNGRTISISRIGTSSEALAYESKEIFNVASSLFEELTNAESLDKDSIDFVFEIDKNVFISFLDTAKKAKEDRPIASGYRRIVEHYSTDAVNEFSFALVRAFVNKIRTALFKNQCRTTIDFIEANRLQKIYLNRTLRNAAVHRVKSSVNRSYQEKSDYLTKANADIATNIQDALNEYNKNLTDAKNKLASMYIDAIDTEGQEYSTFKKRWDKYHDELKKFHEIGILSSTDSVIKPSELKSAFDKKGSFLQTYLAVFEGTLEPLQKDYEKIKLLIDIFNKRNEITNKKLRLTPEGIEVYCGDKKIDVEWLSSGEKNDFVMFYRLIFDTAKNGIVLIDEPEISLHIEWQEEYIDHLINICEMNGLQAIVATHSPNIINGHLELFVDKR